MTPSRPSGVAVDWRGLGATVAIHLVVALWLCQDAVLSLGKRVVGNPDAEVWPFLWGHFWTGHSLLKEGTFPYRTDLLDYPLGGVLWVKDPLSHLLVLPVQVLAGVPVAFTVAEIFIFVASGAGFFLLARLFGISRWVAAFCALTFAFSPHALGEAHNANTEAFSGHWCALWLWAMLRAARSPRASTVVLAALLLLGMLITNQYFGLVMAVASGPVLLLSMRVWRDEQPWRRQLMGAGAAAALGVLLYLPFAWAIHVSLASPDRLTWILLDPPLTVPNVSDLKHLVMPMAPLQGDPLPPFQDLVYPGFAVFGLMLLAPLLGPRNPWRWLWPALGVFFIVMSLGPALMIDGQVIKWEDGSPVWLPWNYLVRHTPLIKNMSLPHRIMVPAGLFFALGMAWSAQGLWHRLRSHRRPLWAIPLVLVLGAFVEILVYPPYAIPLATADTRVPPHAKLLARLPVDGAVLNLPLQMEFNYLRVYMWWQATHGRPIATSLKHPPGVTLTISWLRQLAEAQMRHGHLPRADPMAREQLASAGYGFVVLHDGFFHCQLAERRPYERYAILEQTFGRPLALSDGTLIYALDRERDRVLWNEAGRVLSPDQILPGGPRMDSSTAGCRHPMLGSSAELVGTPCPCPCPCPCPFLFPAFPYPVFSTS